jgi:hypothetical protein
VPTLPPHEWVSSGAIVFHPTYRTIRKEIRIAYEQAARDAGMLAASPQELAIALRYGARSIAGIEVTRATIAGKTSEGRWTSVDGWKGVALAGDAR